MRGLFAEPTPHPAPSDGGLVKAPVAATLSPRERVRLTPMGHRPGSGDSRSFSPRRVHGAFRCQTLPLVLPRDNPNRLSRVGSGVNCEVQGTIRQIATAESAHAARKLRGLNTIFSRPQADKRQART